MDALHSDDEEEDDDNPGAKHVQDPEEEEEDDMFGDKDTKSKAKPSGNQKARALARHEVQGQEAGEEGVEDESGMKIEPFNLKKEFEEGYAIPLLVMGHCIISWLADSTFTEDGVYHVKKDDAAIHDSWLEDLSAKDIKRAKLAQQRQERRQQEEEQSATTHAQSIPTRPIPLWTALLGIVQENEKVSDALRRLAEASGRPKVQHRKKGNQKARQRDDAAAEEASTASAGAKAHAAKLLDILSTICDRLTTLGEYSLYDETGRAITRRLKSEDKIPADAVIPPFIRWDIKWQPAEDAPTHGPYSREELSVWANARYFENGVYIREWQGAQVGSWHFTHGEAFV